MTRSRPKLFRVIWTDEDRNIVDQVVCTEAELEEVLNREFPEGAVVREPAYTYTGLPAGIRPWWDSSWIMPVGEAFRMEINHGMRDAIVLAAIGDERLVEYEMPAGSSALRIVHIHDGIPDKNCGYLRLPLRWLRALVEAESEWIGIPQGNNFEAVPQPAVLLHRRENEKSGRD